MNVRFFGGYKSEYVSIPKHNPIGLYFCADSRELFLGDKLLSDGLRVVPTYADLPSISEHKAAEGVIYFVENTKNGYVLPRGGHDWLQVIYAPTSGEGAEVDLSNYYTKAEVDEAILTAIANIEIEVDLSNYATKEALEAVEAKIPSLDGLASTEYVDNKVTSIVVPSIEGLATETFVKEEIAKIEIPSVPTKVSELENDASYVTEALLQESIEAIDIPQAEIYKVDFNAPNYASALEAYNSGKVLVLINAAPDTTSYALMNYANERYITFTKFLMSRSEAYGAFNTYYLAPDNTWEVSNEVILNKVEANTKEEATEALTTLRVGKQVFSIPVLDGYATEAWVNEQGFLKEHQDLSDYAKKSDIPQPELFVVDYNAPDFAAALEAYNNGKLLLLTNAAPDGNGYAVMNYVREDLITFTKFLMSRSETYGAFNTYYLHSDNTWELAKEVKLNKVEATVNDNDDIIGLTIGKNTYEFDNFATTEVVNQLNENIENNYVSNTTLEEKNYVTEQHITQNYITIQDAATTYVTNEQVTEVVTNEVETVVTEQIETKIETIIQEKVDSGEIEVKTDSISYGEFEDDLI